MMRIAYLSTMYPSLSHTFIEREVRSLRAHGAAVDTFSVRPPRGQDVLSEHHRQAARDTYCILSRPMQVMAQQLQAALRHPLRTLRTYLAGQRLSPPGLRARALHLAYAAEAVVLASELRRRGLRHVHVHFAHNGATVALLATRFDPSIEYSLSMHGPTEFFNVDGFRLREKIREAAFVRCISDFCRGQVMNLCAPEHWDRLAIVHCSVDVKEYTPRPQSEDENHALKLLVVGRLHPIKGIPLLLDAMRDLRDDGLDVHLDIVGDGEQREWLQRRAQELGVDDIATFSGAVGQDAIGAHFDRANVMVLSSFLEGLPVVLMEAMAKELAVVATQVAGVAELVEHGRNGLLIRPGSRESLCDALRWLADHPEQRKAFGKAGRETVEREFDLEECGRQMFECFRRFTNADVAATTAAKRGFTTTMSGEPADTEPVGVKS